MAYDPVCNMTVDPGSAAATEEYRGARFYFCSEGCHRRFVANPSAYVPAVAGPHTGDAAHACTVSAVSLSQSGRWEAIGAAAASGLVATAALLGLYFGVLTLVSGWTFTVEQFAAYWYFIVALALGFGTQVGLFMYLRRAVHAAASGKVVAATGTASGAAMISCCTHYLVNLLPALGATGLVTFVGEYQVELFWFGLLSNLAGIAYIGRRLVVFAQGANA